MQGPKDVGEVGAGERQLHEVRSVLENFIIQFVLEVTKVPSGAWRVLWVHVLDGGLCILWTEGLVYLSDDALAASYERQGCYILAGTEVA